MNEMNAEMAFLLQLTSNIYKKPLSKLPPIQKVNIPRVHQLAIKNKLGYQFSKNLIAGFKDELRPDYYDSLMTFVCSCEEKIEKLSKITQAVTDCLDYYIIVKTFRGYDVIPNDIDILVPEISEAVQKLKNKFETRLLDYEPNHLMVLIDEQKVHLHERISWADSAFLDNELINKSPRIARLWNVDVRIPNVNADFLIYIAHIDFEPLHFTLSDLIYLSKIAPLLDWNVIFSQAEKYHWIRTLTQTMCLLDSFHHTLYGQFCPFTKLNLPHKSCTANSMEMPKSLPRRLILNAFLEKQAFSYLTKKVTKSIQVIATGETYNNFYKPPEQNLYNKIG
jgi:hypothetical protein